MKKIFSICLALYCCLFAQVLLAQAPPQRMTYQFVARNASNQLIQNNAVGLRISILQGSITGNAVYVETHIPQTNGNGTATIEVGGGTVVSGVFANIDWSSGVYFIRTEMDTQGQQGYSVTAVSQLLSVPYAFYAGRATYADSVSGGISETDPTFNASVAASITAADTARWNNSANDWKLTGNAGTNPGANFIGTVDTQDFVVRTNNVERMRVKNNGNVGIGTNVIDPVSSLQIRTQNGGKFKFYGESNNLTYPSFMLLDSTEDIRFISLLTNYNSVPTLQMGFSEIQGINRNISFRINSNNVLHLSGNSNVGIGTINPIEKLHVIGQSIFQEEVTGTHIPIKFTDNAGLRRGQFRVISEPTYTILEMDALEPNATGAVTIRFFRYTNTTGSKSVEFLRGNSSTVSSASIGVDGANSYFQMHGGNVGIGTTTPRSKLEIQGGDVYINNISSGVIMKSPNGSCWRVTVDNTGNLVRTAITCP